MGKQQLQAQMMGFFSFVVAFLLVVVVTCCHGFISTSRCLLSRTKSLRNYYNIIHKLQASFSICLFDDYTTIESPYFTAIFDQLLEEHQTTSQTSASRLYFCTSRTDWNEMDDDNKNRLQYIQSTLLDEADDIETNLIILDDYNPIQLGEEIRLTNSSIIFWVYGSNAFWIRHLLRTSGLGRILQQKQQQEQLSNLFYIGENAGATIVGPTMSVAYAQGDDSKQSPELQIYGLNLLNEHVSFGCTKEELQKHSKTSNLLDTSIEICNNDQVYVWAQRSQSHHSEGQENDEKGEGSSTIIATKFVMTPSRRGMIERYSNPKPILREVKEHEMEGGVACYGEPSIDPSRAVSSIGDSDWFEEQQQQQHET